MREHFEWQNPTPHSENPGSQVIGADPPQNACDPMRLALVENLQLPLLGKGGHGGMVLKSL
jgi:hypothetical protein